MGPIKAKQRGKPYAMYSGGPAGMAGVDKEHVKRTVYEMSKVSNSGMFARPDCPVLLALHSS